MALRNQKRKRAGRSPRPINVTTKAQCLTISRSILSAHGGKIWCENNAGGSAVFGFSLPTLERRGAWTN
jgi:signal transduction histidine kinase